MWLLGVSLIVVLCSEALINAAFAVDARCELYSEGLRDLKGVCSNDNK